MAGKYALIYSTGAFREVGYKAGVAWSDTLMPVPGKRYRKVLQTDVQGVWGQPSRPEVCYLLQSQRPRRSDFTGSQVISPGVASAVQAPGGAWWLYFAGFDLPTGRSCRRAWPRLTTAAPSSCRFERPSRPVER